MRTAALLGLTGLFVAGCTSRGSSPGEGDPCTLLDTTEVAAAIGPLAGPPFRGAPLPDASRNTCEYDTRDYRRLRVSVDWSGGKLAMKMIAFGRRLTDDTSSAGIASGTVLGTGDTLHGSWDAVARTPMQCCSLDALRGDQHVEIDWAGTRLTVAAAGALLDTAIKRLHHPLRIDGAAGIPAARQRWADMAKDSALDACSLVSQRDAEAIIGAPLSSPPDHGTAQTGTPRTSCYYRTRMPTRGASAPDMTIVYEIDVKAWNDAHSAFAEDQYIIGGAIGGARRKIAAATSEDTAAPRPGRPGPWDEMGPAMNMGIEAVKGHILLVASTTGDHDKAVALLAKAISSLS